VTWRDDRSNYFNKEVAKKNNETKHKNIHTDKFKMFLKTKKKRLSYYFAFLKTGEAVRAFRAGHVAVKTLPSSCARTTTVNRIALGAV
jgi:hypothetical protein